MHFLLPQTWRNPQTLGGPYFKVTRFFILCNYISRIIEPIASRCAKFRFKPIGAEVMGERLQYIADKEAGLRNRDSLLILYLGLSIHPL
jgi:DNA polymerase III delta prime subunit